MDEEEDDDVTKELYKDVNVNLGNKDADMTKAEQGGAYQHNVSHGLGFEQEEEDAHVTLTTVHDKTEGPMQSSSVSSYFISKLLNLKNPSPDDNEIDSLINTATIPPTLPLISPPQQQATPTPTPITSEATTVVPDFASIFKFNDRVTNLERDLSELNQVDQYAQAISLIPAIVDRYMDNKLGEATHKAIQEEVKTQLPKILPKAVSTFATLVIERNVTKSLEAVVLARSSSGPKSTYEAAASLSEYELTKILLDKIEESKSHLRADYKKGLYDALVNVTARAEKPPTSFDELTDTPIDFSAFVINRFNITNLTHELLVGPVFNLLKGTCKSLTELEYHFEECSKATTEQLNWHNPEGKPYPLDLLTRLKIMKKYDYGHLDEIEVHREDQQLHTFKEGDFP
ncbi:hypothetical protein Tco_0976619 [Tanacetum coccineum]|uniref:Uncharacterized protein n=1 Tax=Tanacetum coccineum TaxID=301880 RepID=A0ABQ5EI13_9ASTR